MSWFLPLDLLDVFGFFDFSSFCLFVGFLSNFICFYRSVLGIRRCGLVVPQSYTPDFCLGSSVLRLGVEAGVIGGGIMAFNVGAGVIAFGARCVYCYGGCCEYPRRGGDSPMSRASW